MFNNTGKTDRSIRVILGLIIVFLGFYFQSWWGLIGLLPLLTAGLGWCPAYSIFGISTCRIKQLGH